MGVMTSQDFLGSVKMEEKKPVVENTRAYPIQTNKYLTSEKIIPGKSKMAFYHDKQEYCIELTDGMIDVSEQKELVPVLLAKGFKGVVEYQNQKVEEIKSETEKQIEEDKPTPDKVYELIHPDYTDHHDINADIKITVGKKEHDVKIIHGRVETKIKSVYKALLKQGYRPATNYEESLEENE